MFRRIPDLYLLVDVAIRTVARNLDIQKSMAEHLRELRNFEIVIVCDDSGSMATPVDDQRRTRWDELCRIVKMIIPIGVMFDRTGVDIYFLNRPAILNVKDPTKVDDAFREPPSGFTPLVPVLETIFTSNLATRGRDKNLLVLIATDGAPTDDDGNENIADLERTMRETRQADTTYVSFLLCTDDENCVNYMRRMEVDMENIDVTDDYITERNRIRECQRNNNFRFSHGDYVVKALVGAIDPTIGRLDNLIP